MPADWSAMDPTHTLHGRDEAAATAAFVPVTPRPSPLPRGVTGAAVTAGAVLAVATGTTPLVLVVLGGLLAASLWPSARLWLLLPAAAVLHAIATSTAALLGASASSTSLPTTTALLAVLLIVATAYAGRPRGAVIAAVALLGIAATAGYISLGGATAAEAGLDVGTGLALIALAERVVALGLHHRGQATARVRLTVIALAMLPFGMLSLAGELMPSATMPVVIVITSSIVWGGTVAVASRRELHLQQQVDDLTALAATFIESEDRGVISVSRDGLIRAANPAATRTLAGPGGTLVGVSVDSFVAHAHAGRHTADRKAFRSGRMARPMSTADTVQATTLDGRQVQVRLALRRVSGVEEQIIGVVEDLTQQHAEAAALRLQMQRQEAVLDQLKRLEAMRTGLLTAASHELRTPVTVMHGTAELLAARHTELDDATTTVLLERQLAQSQRLVGLLDDLMAVDPDGRVSTAPQTVPLDRVVAATVERWMRRNQDYPVTVLSHRTTGFVDTAALQRILETLLDNARRHGAAPVAVQVRPGDGGGVVTVSDSGGGIPHALLEEIFLPFGRGSSIDEANPGLGLGLPLARILAEADGGTLVAKPDQTGATLELRVAAPALTTANDSVAGPTTMPSLDADRRRGSRRSGSRRASDTGLVVATSAGPTNGAAS